MKYRREIVMELKNLNGVYVMAAVALVSISGLLGFDYAKREVQAFIRSEVRNEIMVNNIKREAIELSDSMNNSINSAQKSLRDLHETIEDTIKNGKTTP